MPDRGRDIAAKLVGLADIYRRYDRVLHLHSKKSVHWDQGPAWRQYASSRSCLGHHEIVRSILSAFDSDPRLGIILPQHFDPVKPFVDWGYDYRRCRDFGRRLGIEVTRDQPLEFSSGSMFWARSAALRPLLDLDLSFDHFPAESFKGGTLAHVIERLYLRICERSGHTWMKAGRPDLLQNATNIVRVDSPANLNAFLSQRPYLLSDSALRRRAAADLNLPCPRFRFLPGRSSRPRLTLLASGTPVGDPGRTGGVLDIFLRVTSARSDADVRIVGSAVTLRAAGAIISKAQMPSLELLPTPDNSIPPPPLEIRGDEVLFCGCWRDAVDARSLHDCQESFFGGSPRLVYLILDTGPYEAAPPLEQLAEAEGCRKARDAIVVLGTAMMAARLRERGYAFARHEVLQPLWNTALDGALRQGRPLEAEPVLLVDWRPSQPESIADLAAAAIGRWFEQDPQSAGRWKVYGIGEPGADVALAPGRTLRNLGPLSTDEYVRMLQQARMGLSLTLSGAVSNIALEMAACGIATVVAPCRAFRDPFVRTNSGLRAAGGLDIDSIAAALVCAAQLSPRRPNRGTGTQAPAGFWSVPELDALAQRIIAWTSRRTNTLGTATSAAS